MDEQQHNLQTKPEQELQKKGGSLLDTIKFIVLALAIVTPIRMFIAQPFIVSGSSMDPTFATGQYLIVDEISYHLGDPKRGDVIILRYPKDTTKFFIKRVIGLPHENVVINKGTVTIVNAQYPEGLAISEPYIKFSKNDTMTKMLGEGEYFVMGDNRAASSDSRYWGVVPRDLVVGRALIRLLPIASASVLPGDFN
ncbi:MAG: signal peptidase I [bacterium]|nr:signal peptidase I [bacterium]